MAPERDRREGWNLVAEGAEARRAARQWRRGGTRGQESCDDGWVLGRRRRWKKPMRIEVVATTDRRCMSRGQVARIAFGMYDRGRLPSSVSSRKPQRSERAGRPARAGGVVEAAHAPPHRRASTDETTAPPRDQLGSPRSPRRRRESDHRVQQARPCRRERRHAPERAASSPGARAPSRGRLGGLDASAAAPPRASAQTRARGDAVIEVAIRVSRNGTATSAAAVVARAARTRSGPDEVLALHPRESASCEARAPLREHIGQEPGDDAARRVATRREDAPPST